MRNLLLSVVLWATCAAAAPVADAPAVAPAPAAETASAAVDDGGAAPSAPLTPLMRDIVAACAANEAAVAALEAALAGTDDPGAALVLIRQIEDLRCRLEVELLRIQARHARLAGRVGDAAQIEAAVAAMTSPRPLGEPAARTPSREAR